MRLPPPPSPPLEAVADVGHSSDSLPRATGQTAESKVSFTVSSIAPSLSCSPSPSALTAASASPRPAISFDPPVLTAPTSRFLDLMTPLRGTRSQPADPVADNDDVISLTSGGDDGVRSQLGRVQAAEN